MKILVMGLPGSGKSVLATRLAQKLKASHFNADAIRAMFNDWDFTDQGRIRQAERMRSLCEESFWVPGQKHAIADFVCPTEELRSIFKPDYTIFMDTIGSSRFGDTNALFKNPENPDYTVKVLENDTEAITDELVSILETRPSFEDHRPTGLMLGRFQPFHGGHLKLFEKILEKTGQVSIMVRTTMKDTSNPFGFAEVRERIHQALKAYRGRYNIIPVPNITGIYYGRDVGYEIEKITLDAQTESISATAIRADINKSTPQQGEN